jgi:hypothetical protein
MVQDRVPLESFYSRFFTCKYVTYLYYYYYYYYHDLGMTIDGYGLVNGFIDHLVTPLGTTSNLSAIANLHGLQLTTR